MVAVESSSSAWSGRPRLKCGEPAAESGELIRRQLGNNFSDFFDFMARSIHWRGLVQQVPCLQCWLHEIRCDLGHCLFHLFLEYG